MYLVGERSVPWLVDVPGEGLAVSGELYEVDERTLASMDRLEGVGRPDGYVRSRLAVERIDATSRTVDAWAYLKPPSQLTAELARVGPLAEYTREHASRYRKRTAADAMHVAAVAPVVAPDGFLAQPLGRLAGGSMARFELAAGCVSRAVRHRSVEEIWFVMGGGGELWRRQGEWEEVLPLESGVCVTIPLGTSFQFRSTSAGPLVALAVTMPPWPGDDEATLVEGQWPPST
jgi:mannose-6-phosphate isomerase-like protein (cupin superfamily)